MIVLVINISKFFRVILVFLNCVNLAISQLLINSLITLFDI